MARPGKSGLDYFQLDIDIYEDDKILLAEEIIDPDGDKPWLRFAVSSVAIRLLREIFKEGYFIGWDETAVRIKSSKMGSVITSAILQKIVSALIESEFFNSELYKKYKILTSRGIQRRWFYITVKMNRTIDKINEHFKLIIEEDVLDKKKWKKETLSKKQETLSKKQETLSKKQETPSGEQESAHIIYTVVVDNTISNLLKDNKDNTNNIITTTIIEQETPSGEQETPSGEQETPSGEQETPSGEQETPSGEQETPEKDYYVGNWHLRTTPEKCKEYYFSHSYFDIARTNTLKVLYNYYKVEDMNVLQERLGLWADEFNELLHRREPDGIAMKGLGGYPDHFHNWLNTQKERLKKTPNKRIDASKDEKKAVGHIPQTKDLKELEDAYTYKRNK